MGDMTISELKARGKEAVSRYFWQAMLVSLILSLLTGGSGNQSISQGREQVGEIAGSFGDVPPGVLLFTFMAGALVLAVVGILITLLHIFVLDVLEVGKDRFYMESRELGASAGISRLFWVFRSGHYLNVVKILFFRNLKLLLWSLLFVIPGIYKAYEYAMVPYLLSENPEAASKDVFAQSRRLMTGRRFKLFCLEISYILWYLLPFAVTIFNPLIGMLALVLVTLCVSPFMEAAVAEFYAALRGEVQEIRLRGFTESSWQTGNDSSEGFIDWRRI